MTAPELPVRFGGDGLIPAVIQDAETNSVLMIGFMNERALAATRESGRVHFWSRSRQTLWRKGERSGHEQIVREIYVNCEQNSLLLVVDQVGAVCHDGYDTCFYRRLDPGNQLVTVRERAFDPATVYGRGSTEPELASLSLAHYEAFAYLRDHDLAEVSGTSARLRRPDGLLRRRIADELRELAGVLDGNHRHTDLRSDLLLEGTQVLYWVTLTALGANVSWAELRSDRALATTADDIDPDTIARLLRADADHWDGPPPDHADAARLHASLALVGQAVHLADITPRDLIEADLADLRAKPYMHAFFSAAPPAVRG
jgi:phosphoribosyl-AMP cyclohydrolase